MSTLYTVKFNINEKIYKIDDGELKLNDLLETIFLKLNQTIKVVDSQNEDIKYKFVNLDRDYENQILTGRMIKYYDGVNSTYNEENDELINEFTANKADYVTFSFDFKTEIIGFVPMQSFSKEAFIKYFELLVHKTVPEAGIVVLILLIDGRELEEKFKKIAVLKEVQINIVPENGMDEHHFAHMVEVLDGGLKESNAQRMSINLKGTKREPLKKKAKLISSFKSVAKKAYARFIAIGYKENGEEYSIDTRKDTLLKRPVPGHSRDSIPLIKELTQDAAQDYMVQKIKEAKADGGEEK